MKYIKISIFFIILLFSFYYISEASIVGEFNSEAKAIETQIPQENKITLNDKYNSKKHKEMQNKLIDTIYDKVNKKQKHITNYKIKRSFISAKARLEYKDDFTYEEYYNVVALILATMETESNFKNIICYNTNGSIDYGIMQVNTSIISEIENDLGNLDIENSKKDNIEAGSWEIYKCYEKASKKHPKNIIWWTYAYYNRGMYFEKYDYDYDQADTRSKIFIKKYNKYYKLIKGAFYENQNEKRNN